MRLPLTIADYRLAAKNKLPRQIFDYLDGGAEQEHVLSRNQLHFLKVELLPKVFTNVSDISLKTELFGERISMPIVVAPTGMNSLICKDADVFLAQAAAKANVPFVLSTASSSSLEEIASKVGGNLWFQLYFLGRETAADLVQRALVCNYKTLIVTADTVTSGLRERDLRNNFEQVLADRLFAIKNSVRYPEWFCNQIGNNRAVFGNLQNGANRENQATSTALMARRMDPTITWEDIRVLRDKWPHKLLVKGSLGAEDIAHCREVGVSGIVLSNHGGRQLDCVPSAFDLFMSVSAQVKTPLLLDGGVRRGADIVKAVALGAKAVFIGRPLLYGLAVSGLEGACRVLELFTRDLERTLTLIGCQSIDALDRTYIF